MFSERITGAKKALRKRYRKYLKIPQWSKIEIAGMGKSLRSNIIVGLEEKERATRRLEWDAMAYLAKIDDAEAVEGYATECELRWLGTRSKTEEEPKQKG